MNKLVRKNKKGFTLTEMIVVIAIIGILAAVMIPGVIGYVNYARRNAAYQEASAILDIYESWETTCAAGLSSDETKYFNAFYEEISEKPLSNNVYMKFTDVKNKNPNSAVSLIYISGNISVTINLDSKEVIYGDKNIIPETSKLIDSEFDLLSNLIYE